MDIASSERSGTPERASPEVSQNRLDDTRITGSRTRPLECMGAEEEGEKAERADEKQGIHAQGTKSARACMQMAQQDMAEGPCASVAQG